MLIGRRQVEELTGLSRATIYSRMAQGKFPKPVHFSGNKNLWVRDEIAEWVAERIRERDAKTSRAVA